jgi:hypothetical protein
MDPAVRLQAGPIGADVGGTMDTTVVTLIPALLAPLAAAVPAFPVHGRVPMSATSAGLLARTVPTVRTARSG